MAADLVEVYRAGSLPEAHSLRLMLEDAGIAAQVENDMLHGALGEFPLGWSTCPRLMVPPADTELARTLLDEYERSTTERRQHQSEQPESADGSVCLACGAALGLDDVCPKCGWTYCTAADLTDDVDEAG